MPAKDKTVADPSPCDYPWHPIRDENLKSIKATVGGQQRWYVCPHCGQEGWASISDEVPTFD